MELTGGVPSAHAILDEVQATLRPEAFQDGRSDLGAPLLLALACRLRGHALEGDILAAMASRLQLKPLIAEQIANYADLLIQSAQKGRPVTLCRGVTCSMRGADSLHGQVISLLSEFGLEPPTARVHCLSQCSDGPSIMVDRTIWVTRARAIVQDKRDWRGADSGPVPITDTTRPALD